MSWPKEALHAPRIDNIASHQYSLAVSESTPLPCPQDESAIRCTESNLTPGVCPYPTRCQHQLRANGRVSRTDREERRSSNMQRYNRRKDLNMEEPTNKLLCVHGIGVSIALF